jgi:acetolactate synthase I/II/III large subunit
MNTPGTGADRCDMKKLGEYLIEALASQGVRHVFGIPGVHNLELYRGLARGPIRHISGRHEQGLGFMADGYARVSGQPGVCFTITGPGLTNIVTAMGQAYGDSVPLLVISSQNRLGENGGVGGFLHELRNQRAVAGGVAALTFSIESPAELPVALERAFATFASSRPRPVYIEVPLDVLAADASELPLPKPVAITPRPSASLVESAAALLRSAQRPVILAGGGAVRAAAELRALAERLDAPVVMTANARGLLPAGHPLAVPMSPMLAPVRALVAAADVVLAVGTEFGPTDYSINLKADFPNPRQLIRIDIDAEQLTRGATPLVGLHGEAKVALDLLAAADLGPNRAAGGAARAAAGCSAALEAIGKFSPSLRQHIDVLDLIRDTLPDALMVGDSTQLVYGGNLGFNARHPGSWFNSATGYGTLGYALPASTGAGLAAPDRPVVCLVGDGGLQFSMSELAVLGDVKAWTAVIIWNNQGYGEIRTSMLAVGIEPEGVDVRPPDFADIARAYGYSHRTITSREALETALGDFGRRRQVMILEIPADEFARGSAVFRRV